MSSLTSFTTRREAAEYLGVAGVVGDAAERMLRESAPARAEWRVQQAVAAARRAAEADSNDSAEQAALLWAVLAADRYGIGGNGGVSGDATVRVPALRGLGTGRKQAHDGGAWTAAIIEAAVRTHEGMYYIPGTEVEPILFVGTGGYAGTYVVSTMLIPLEWQRTIAAEGLRRSLGLPTRFPDVPLGYVGHGGPADWGRVLNHIETEIKAVTSESDVSDI